MEPMLRWRPARAVIALGLLGGVSLAVVAGFLSLVWLLYPLVYLGILAAAIASPTAASAVWRGGWSPSRSRTQQIAVAVVAIALAGGAALAASQAVEASRVSDLGVPIQSDLGIWLVLAAAALASLAAFLAAAPRGLPRTATTFVAAIAALGGVGALAAAATAAVGVGCADARLDRATWRAALRDHRHATVTDGERIAVGIVDCGLLDGRSRAEVRRRLGRPQDAYTKRWEWEVGTVGDALGPGDGRTLTLHFGRDGRVTRSELYESG